MRIWPDGAIRSFSVISVLLGLLGIWLQLDSLLRYAPRGLSRLPYELPAFYIEGSIDTLCALGTVVAGVLLWKRGRAGRVACNLVFGSEIAYFIGNILIILVLMTAGGEKGHAIGLAMGAVGGIAGMGTAFQYITLYPVIALIVVNLAHRTLNRKSVLRETPAA